MSGGDCLSCAWHCIFGDLCYCPAVVAGNRRAQLGLFEEADPLDVGRCPLTGHAFRRLRLGTRVGGCEHHRRERRDDDMPWLELSLGSEVSCNAD